VRKKSIITKIEVQKKNPKRRSIYLNGEFAFGISEEVFFKFPLAENKEIDEKEIEEILFEEKKVLAKEIALNFLSYRPRTEKELIKKLKSKGFEEEILEETVRNLKRLNLIDDYEYAKNFVNERLRLSPRGENLLRQELWKKGIEKETIDEVLKEVFESKNEEEIAQKVLEKAKKKYRNLDKEVAQRRIKGFLLRRGFSFETVNELVKDSD
jgi:regulatory protein